MFQKVKMQSKLLEFQYYKGYLIIGFFSKIKSIALSNQIYKKINILICISPAPNC